MPNGHMMTESEKKVIENLDSENTPPQKIKVYVIDP